jgi:hypothetical protein
LNRTAAGAPEALHLQEIALVVEPGAHAVLFLDRAWRHVTAKLGVPEAAVSAGQDP